ncbi:thioredoxin family protein [Dehalobacter restrictus]|uniref:Redox-active disulfide protein n=1 Tax=Dehalobacter restrictus (strain DSM 9455 / PER-K23) TaxID=871738 RepID=A0ABN4BRV3_DEHRP|nr:thioredoxin family protein [Dehalobacter restrictus]AHF08741.1 redox-active disulfide protein [Dehalobacter restrictus DSM 9455]
MNIKILGSGCSNCKKLQAVTEEAVKDAGVDATIEKVEDIKKIMAYGVMRTPALVINEKIKAFGRIPTKDEIKKYIKEV